MIATLFGGGGERVVSELSQNFPEHIDTTILLYENKVSYPFRGKLIHLGVPISKNFVLRVYYFFVRLVRFKQILAKENPDRVVSFGYASNMMNLLINKEAVARADLFLSRSTRGFFGGIYKLFVKLFFKRAFCVIAVSRAIKQDLIFNFGVPEEKIHVIHNPIDIERIKRLSQQPLLGEHRKIFQHPVIINMGRLTEQKSQWHLLKAFRSVKDAVPETQLVILGDGELRSDLEKLVDKLSLQGSVHFLGWQKNPFQFLSRSKMFVLSSLWEGLPDVLLEAMACGLPIISTDCKSGPREILAPSTSIEVNAKDVEYAKYGILVPVCDGSFSGSVNLTKEEEMLAEAMLRLNSDTELSFQLTERSKERAEDFRVEKIIQEWNLIL